MSNNPYLLSTARYPLVMGIVNVTPDSFYPPSRCLSEQALGRRIEQMIAHGVDWLDLGGYSTRPGAATVSEDEEWARIKPAMALLRRQFPEWPVSIDTFRAGVVRRAYEQYGAFIVNDISAGDDDPDMLATVARCRLPYIAMHKRGTPQTMSQHCQYADVVREVKEYLAGKIAEGQAAGVHELIIDPGFGFAKTTAQNYALLRRLNEFSALGCPVLVGVSRKRMLWEPLSSTPDDMLCATSAIHLQALLQGADVLRVHDVKAARQMIRLAQTLLNEESGEWRVEN